MPDVVADYGAVVDFQDDAEGFAQACRKVADDSLDKRDAKLAPLLRMHHWDSIASRMEQLVTDAARRPVVPSLSERDGGPFDYIVVGAGFAGSTIA
ncbi:MAG: hypothetical protein M3290_01885, partial [Actinomycetota bacterium]|nr:hypothetical protein [Actinomycetota bacterium]